MAEVEETTANEAIIRLIARKKTVKRAMIIMKKEILIRGRSIEMRLGSNNKENERVH